MHLLLLDQSQRAPSLKRPGTYTETDKENPAACMLWLHARREHTLQLALYLSVSPESFTMTTSSDAKPPVCSRSLAAVFIVRQKATSRPSSNPLLPSHLRPF